MKIIKYYILIAVIWLVYDSCMVGPKYSRPAINMPTTYSENANLDTLPIIKWFDLFHDTVLQNLIKVTLENNKDLMTSLARIEEASYSAKIVNTNLYPSLFYNFSGGGGRSGTEAQKIAAGIDGGYLYGAAQLNWEIDLWGKLRRATRSVQAQYLAEIDNSNAIRVSLVSQVASSYFLLLDLDNRLKITERTLASRQENTRINTDRFNKGYSAELDKLQAMQQEAIAASTIPQIQRQIIQTENSIRVLMGLGPGHIKRGDSLYAQVLPPDIPSGLPSQLLERRPDIRSSERNLQSVFEQIGIAQANLFPDLSLTGILGFASPQLSTLLSSGGFIANGLAQLTGPIFQFNKNKMRVEAAKQRTKQAAFQYEQTILIAMGEVDNALAETRTLTSEYNHRLEEVEASRQALVLSQARYDYGYTSYLEVIVSETNLFDAELQASAVFQQRLASIVDLYKALGGGWDTGQP